MGNIQILISTMYLKNAIELLEKMNISTDAIIINQCDENCTEKISYKGCNINIISTTDRGLSKSRNLAIENSTAEILIFADDDFRYEDDYLKTVQEAYDIFPEAEAIIFGAIRNDGFRYRQISNGKMKEKYKYSINSIRISVKRSALFEKQIRFDERFGAGTEINSGEDTIFINDSFNKKVKFYSYNHVICKGLINERESTWWHGYDEKFFINRGCIFRRLSKLYILMILYFASKHFRKYKKEISFHKAVSLMLKGARECEKRGVGKSA